MSQLIKPITTGFGIAGQVQAEDIATITAAGYKSIIINRPDFEGGAVQPTAAEITQLAQAAGLQVKYQPVDGHALTIDDVMHFAELLKILPAPVLAYCRSGTRCYNLFSQAQAYL